MIGKIVKFTINLTFHQQCMLKSVEHHQGTLSTVIFRMPVSFIGHSSKTDLLKLIYCEWEPGPGSGSRQP